MLMPGRRTNGFRIGMAAAALEGDCADGMEDVPEEKPTVAGQEEEKDTGRQGNRGTLIEFGLKRKWRV